AVCSEGMGCRSGSSQSGPLRTPSGQRSQPLFGRRRHSTRQNGPEASDETLGILTGHAPQSLRLLPCFPFQNGQKGQSSPCGKSSPSSCGQPMFPWLIATDLTPYRRKKSFISCWTFGLVVTSVATHRFRIGSAPSCRITPAAIFVVVLSSGPYVATVPMGYCGCCRPELQATS